MTNSDERSRIDHLLNSGKISEADHLSLVEALERKPALLKRAAASMINPFSTLSVSLRISIGMLSIIILALLGAKLAICFPGALDFQVVQDGKRIYTTSELFVQNIIDVCVLSFVFYGAALVSPQRNLRIIDFVSSTFLTRLPYAIFMIVLSIVSAMFPELLPRHARPPIAPAIGLAVGAASFLVWTLTAMFSAFKESSGMRHRNLWIAFVSGLLAAEAISYTVNALILR